MHKEYEQQKEDLKLMVKCPACTRLASFSLYQHIETKETLPVHVGLCRRQACQYVYTAKRFFKEHPEFGNQEKTQLHAIV